MSSDKTETPYLIVRFSDGWRIMSKKVYDMKYKRLQVRIILHPLHAMHNAPLFGLTDEAFDKIHDDGAPFSERALIKLQQMIIRGDLGGDESWQRMTRFCI